jgi:hypothetical protein
VHSRESSKEFFKTENSRAGHFFEDDEDHKIEGPSETESQNGFNLF